MEISVIIPVYNNPRDLAECVAAIRASAPAVREIIVVDDGSTDDTVHVAVECGSRVLRRDKNAGPAAARNYGAQHASGEILFFVDADVVLAADAISRLSAVFTAQPQVAAVFGSYDAAPRAPGLLSRYRNLLHHFVHQQGCPDAATFWAGCGAIRKRVFEEVGGFDEKRFARPSIEDIELGYRLRTAGYRIVLDRSVHGKHLKHWTFRSMLRTDIFDRAVPWARLICEGSGLPNDLNLKSSQRASFALVVAACILLALALYHPAWVALALIALAAVASINRGLYLFFFRKGGLLFAAGCMALHFLYFLYSGFTYLLVAAAVRCERIARRPTRSKAGSSLS